MKWLPVKGYEGMYEVSDSGEVRSIDRTVIDRNGKSRRLPGRGLKPKSRDGFHLYVDLSKNNIVTRCWVHRLVLEAFVEPRGEHPIVRHLNGDALDNRVENLAWGSQSENHFDAVRHGTHFQSSKTECPRGHLLEHPNLVIGTASIGRRSCKACNRTHSLIQRNPSLACDFKEISDKYLTQIMGE